MTEDCELKWSAQVPIFKNSIILRQLGLAIGVPFGMLCIFLGVVGRGVYRFYGLAVIGLLLLVTFLFILAVYGGKYQVGYILNLKGICAFTLPKQAWKNRIINGLTAGLGLFSGNPAAAGAGMLAQSRQTTFLRWNRIRKVKCFPKKKVILVRGAWTERIALFCSPENYPWVEEFVQSKTGVSTE